jgi:hypothetical protein
MPAAVGIGDRIPDFGGEAGADAPSSSHAESSSMVQSSGQPRAGILGVGHQDHKEFVSAYASAPGGGGARSDHDLGVSPPPDSPSSSGSGPGPASHTFEANSETGRLWTGTKWVIFLSAPPTNVRWKAKVWPT